MKTSIAKVIILLLSLIGPVTTVSLAQQGMVRIEGKVIKLAIVVSQESTKPELWPALLLKDREIVLLGNSAILEELYYLSGGKAALEGRQLPKQTFGQNEYECFEVSEIKKIDDRDYISSQAVTEEFREALKARHYLDDTGKLTIKEAIKSIWFDKNENGIIDVGDRLFVAEKTTGKTTSGPNILYPLKAVIRQQKYGLIFYDTFVFKDPFPAVFEPAVLGRLNYDTQTNSYSVSVEKIYKGGDSDFVIPESGKENIILEANDALKPFIGKRVLLSGDRYENIIWHGDITQEINRKGGQYLFTVKGKISIANIRSQKPWEVSLVLLKDSAGVLYELRRVGYVGTWRKLLNKEVTITGALRPHNFYKGKLIFALEVINIE